MEKCSLLARVYGTTVDSLLNTNTIDGIGVLPPAPIGKNIWGVVTVNERGQIVIPKGARDTFELNPGSRLIVGSDETGIALIPDKTFEEIVKKFMKCASGAVNRSDED